MTNEQSDAPSLLDVVIWRLKSKTPGSLDAYILLVGENDSGHFEGIKAWEDVYAAAEKHGKGGRIWLKDGETVRVIAPWPRHRP